MAKSVIKLSPDAFVEETVTCPVCKLDREIVEGIAVLRCKYNLGYRRIHTWLKRNDVDIAPNHVKNHIDVCIR